MVGEQKNSSKQNKIGKLTIKNYTSESVKYLGVIINEDKSPNRFTRMNKKC